MKKIILTLLTLMSINAHSQINGRLVTVEVLVDGYTREKEFKHDINGTYLDSDGSVFKRTQHRMYPPKVDANYLGKEVNELLEDFSSIIMENEKLASITYVPAQARKSMAKEAGVDKNAMMNQLKGSQALFYMDYFPEQNIQKNLIDSVGLYYSIYFKFNRGMSQDPMIVMDQEKPGWIKFNIETTIKCFDEGGDLKWEKSLVENDFSSFANGSIKKNHFKYESSHQLSKDMISKCLQLSLKETFLTPN